MLTITHVSTVLFIMLLRHSLSSAVRSARITNLATLSIQSVKFHCGQPLYKFKQRNYDRIKDEQAAADNARIAAESTTTVTEEKKVNYFSWSGIMHVRAKAKEMWKMYGVIGTVTYATTYALFLGGYYYLLKNGIISTTMIGFEEADAIEKLSNSFTSLTGSTSFPDYLQAHPELATLAIAMGATEVSEIVRLPLCLVLVPRIARLIGTAPKK